jgi:SAM-dependent methyltransferase
MSTTGNAELPRRYFQSGDRYEAYVGRWSRLVARDFLSWLAMPPHLTWLDVGCGTGALVDAVLTTQSPAAITGIDPSAGFINHARAGNPDTRAQFAIGDARDLPVADRSVDVVVSGLVLHFVPAAEQIDAVREMRRVTRSGGTVAVYLWDYAEGMQMMRHFWDAAIALDSMAANRDEAPRFAICHPGPLGELFTAAGLEQVAVRAITVPTTFTSFDDYWQPFLGGEAPAPAYAMSLDDTDRNALRDEIQRRLPIAPDGSITRTARAWAARAIAP